MIFDDLIALKTLQNIQDEFSDVFEIPAIIYDVNGDEITNSSRFTKFCELMRSTQKGYKTVKNSEIK